MTSFLQDYMFQRHKKLKYPKREKVSCCPKCKLLLIYTCKVSGTSYCEKFDSNVYMLRLKKFKK